MKKLDFVKNRSEFLLYFAILFTIFSINLTFKIYEFYEFKSQNYKFYNGEILLNYEKTNQKNKTYRVLKVKTKDFEFYTTTHKNNILQNVKFANFGIVTKNVKFVDFLKKRFYMPNFKISPKSNFKSTKKQILINFISKQHENAKMKEFYSALYFATPISSDLRNDITLWGIAHIVAISGFHLGIIFAVSFFILMPIYKFIQRRYFPYRSAKFDISIFVIFLMIIYLFVLDFTPSFLRSLFMFIVGFFLLIRNFKIINYQTLFITISLLIAIFPHLLFSIGFYFSTLGVLFIFIYLRHFYHNLSFWQNVVFLNLFVWFCMNVPVYYFFPTITLQQLSVILISYIFIIFYPISILLHIFEIGGIFDEYLLDFLNFHLPYFKTQIPFWLFIFANLSVLLATKFKNFAFISAFLGILPIFFI